MDERDTQDRFMLALCIWREARSESFLGKVLVAQVIKNRMYDNRWPDTYTGVILQPLQFSAFNKNDPQATLFPKDDDKSWSECFEAAVVVMAADVAFTTANHYHAKNVKPSWADPLKVKNIEGNHIFYEL